MPVTANLLRKLCEKLGDEVGADLAPWLNEVEARRREVSGVLLLHRPPQKVREALGEDVVDELMDLIIAVFNRGYRNYSHRLRHEMVAMPGLLLFFGALVLEWRYSR